MEFTLQPQRMVEPGPLPFVGVLLELKRDSQRRLGPMQLIMLAGDVSAIAHQVREVATGHSTGAQPASLERDFILDVRPDMEPVVGSVVGSWSSETDDESEEAEEPRIAIGFWTGERDDLMRGYRFTVSARQAEAFAESLSAELTAVLDE